MVGRPEATNLLSIYAAMTDQTLEQVVAEFAGKRWPDFKPRLTEAVISALLPVSARMRELLADKGELDRILTFGSARATNLAEPVMHEVREVVGFIG